VQAAHAADANNVCAMILTCHDEPIEDAPSDAPAHMAQASSVSQTPDAAPMQHDVQAQLSTQPSATHHCMPSLVTATSKALEFSSATPDAVPSARKELAS
jgi:hypothetical protein